jgi:hypothetical protein
MGKDNLKPGDQMISVIDAGTKDYTGSIFAIYKFNSDLKGNVIVYPGKHESACSEERMAMMLPRAYLAALGSGVDKLFWFRLRASERKEPKWNPQEENLGIVHADLAPKPGYHSYKALVDLCPSGSTRPILTSTRRNNLWTASWKRPDGVKVWALWTQMQSENVTMKIGGTLTEAKDYLGKNLSLPKGDLSLGNGPIYLIGPNTVKLDLAGK